MEKIDAGKELIEKPRYIQVPEFTQRMLVAYLKMKQEKTLSDVSLFLESEKSSEKIEVHPAFWDAVVNRFNETGDLKVA